MEPTLEFLVPVRDVVSDSLTNELILIRPFDLVLIPKGQESIIYSFDVAGRVLLNVKGKVNSQFQIDLLDPEGIKMQTASLGGEDFEGELGVNIPAQFLFIKFTKEGKYCLQTRVNINGGAFKTLEPKAYFWVKKDA
ncbi:MAG: hypothetical protein KGI73_01905 [Patescibacteria group bacterium]|nr:hypothetical protein [Patescibacteria group bacterium]